MASCISQSSLTQKQGFSWEVRRPWLSKGGEIKSGRGGHLEELHGGDGVGDEPQAPAALRIGEGPLGMESSPLVLKEITPGAHSISQVLEDPWECRGQPEEGISAVHLAKFGFDERTGARLTQSAGTLSLP